MVNPRTKPLATGVVVVGLSRYQVKSCLFFELLKAFSVDKDDFTSIFTKMLGRDNASRLETQVYIQEFEETAVSLGYEPEELTMSYRIVAERIKDSLPPWVDVKDIQTVWFRTYHDVLIFYK